MAMSKLIAGCGGFLTLLSFIPALAAVEYDYAPVISAVPVVQIVEVSTPVQQCREEQLVAQQEPYYRGSFTPMLLSTIAGGAIGNAVGHGKSNKQIGAVLGAVLGHSIGRDMIRHQQSRLAVGEYYIVERCEMVYQNHQEERIVGYQVTYQYNSRDYSVRTAVDPGESIRVQISVQPVL
jgi:uncharacterized protein YcfJ